MRVRVEGGSADQRGAIAHALRALGCEIDEGAELCVAIRAGMPLRLDPLAGTAIVAGRSVRLTRIELALLGCLIEAEAPLARAALIAGVWGYSFDPGTNMVAVHISRLRAKLGAAVRITYAAEGYRLEPFPATSPAEQARTPRNRTPARRCS